LREQDDGKWTVGILQDDPKFSIKTKTEGERESKRRRKWGGEHKRLK
jgi:hypothetical protein